MSKKLFGAFVALLTWNGTAAAETCTLPKIADTAALEQLPGADLMTVPVAINGAAKHFLLDIGTNPTEVSQATVAQLGLPQSRKLGETIGGGGTSMGGLTSMGRPDLESLTNGGLSNVPVYDAGNRQGRGALNNSVRIASFTIGGATAHNMVFLVANDSRMGSQSKPYDGLLTGDFFKQYDVEIDFGNKQINWLTPTECIDPNQVVFWSHREVAAVPMTISPGGKIQVPVTVNGHSINAVVDTSSAQTIVRRDVAELILDLKPDTPEMMPDGDLKDSLGAQVYRHTFPQMAFEGVVATNVPALIETNSMIQNSSREKVLGSQAQMTGARIPDITIGMDVLRQLHLYVVFGQSKLYVTAAQ
jgi:predicted aspartyl protease